MKYFIDTEFHERTILGIDTIELISMAIVREDSEYLYEISNEFSLNAASSNIWLRDNVIVHLPPTKTWISRETIKAKILNFIPPESNPTFYGYYADYDWVVFCWLFGRMIDLPKGYPMWCYDIKQLCFELGNPELPKQEVGEHNALEDARYNKTMYDFLINLKK